MCVYKSSATAVCYLNTLIPPDCWQPSPVKYCHTAQLLNIIAYNISRTVLMQTALETALAFHMFTY